MAAQLTAFDVLALLLVFGSVGALCGWAGGAGARLTFAVRLDRVEHAVMQILNRAKGAAGGQVAQRLAARTSSVEKEAEQLAAQLARAPRRGFLSRLGRPIRTAADAAEEAALEEMEREKNAARKAESS